jgi:hypothetical protein
MLAFCRAVGVALIAGLALSLLTLASSAQDGRLLARHQAAGQTCSACHRETPPAVKPAVAVCQACHGDQGKLAAATAKADPNPHAPPHLEAGGTQTCGECHSIHKQSEVSCTDCHRGFQFNVK